MEKIDKAISYFNSCKNFQTEEQEFGQALVAALRDRERKLDEVAEAMGHPRDAWKMAGCDVLAHYVKDAITNTAKAWDEVSSLTLKLVASELREKEKDEALSGLIGTHREPCAEPADCPAVQKGKTALKSSPANHPLAEGLLAEHEAGNKYFESRGYDGASKTYAVFSEAHSRVRALLRGEK